MQQQPGRRGDGGGGSCWYSGAAAGRQAAPRRGSAGALLFLLLLLLFLDPRNSEQAAAGAAPLLRREGDRKGWGMSIPLDVMCSIKHSRAAVQMRPRQGSSEPAWWTSFLRGVGMGETGFRAVMLGMNARQQCTHPLCQDTHAYIHGSTLPWPLPDLHFLFFSLHTSL